jgi:hypothetical protein
MYDSTIISSQTQLDAFVIGTDSLCYRNKHAITVGSNPPSGSWSGWKVVGGTQLVSEVAAVSTTPGPRLDIFALAANHRIVTSHSTGKTWSEWEPHGDETFVRPPAAGATTGSNIFVFGVDLAHNVVWKKFNGKEWTPDWTPIDGMYSMETVTAVKVTNLAGPESLQVFSVGMGRKCYMSVLKGGTFTAAAEVAEAGDIQSPVAAVGGPKGKAVIFYLGDDSEGIKADAIGIPPPP